MIAWIGIFALAALSLVVMLLPLWSRHADRVLGEGIETNDISAQWEAEKDRLVKEQHDLDVALMEGRLSKEIHAEEHAQVVKDAERALQRLRDARAAEEKAKQRGARKPQVYHGAGAMLAASIVIMTAALTFYLNGLDIVRQSTPQTTKKAPGQAEIAKMVASLEQRVKAGGASQKEELMLARSYLVLGRRAESIELYEKVHAADEKNLDAVMALGEIYFSSKDKAEQVKALPFFDKVLAQKPDMPEALWYKSLALVRARRLDEARVLLVRLRDIASDNKEAQAAVSQLLTELDKSRGKTPKE